MHVKGAKAYIEIVPKRPDLEEEFFHFVIYMVQQFACLEDARNIESFFERGSHENEFIGKTTRITLTQTVAAK